jgi:hypothetical protein
MPSRFHSIIGFVLITLGIAAPVSAQQCFWGFFRSIGRDFKTRNCWPEPHVCPDLVSVQQPMCAMVNNGWRRQNMLGDIHFQPGTAQLTESGKRKVRWILTACPEQHRLVYVHIADTGEETAARIAAVRQLTLQIAPVNLPPILVTSISDDGWPAEEVDAILRKYYSSMPPPRLPPKDSSSTGSGTSGS